MASLGIAPEWTWGGRLESEVVVRTVLSDRLISWRPLLAQVSAPAFEHPWPCCEIFAH